MASLSFRRSSLVRTVGNNLRPVGTTNVMPCKNGGIATSSSSGATLTMAAGHGFAVGDKVLINPGTGQVYSSGRSVSSITATTIVMSGTSPTLNVAIGDVIWNLGADTSSATTPNYDAPVTCYTGPSAATTLATANSNNGYAVTNADGEFQYWHIGGPIWELYLQGSTVIEYDISSGYPMGGQLILREPAPYATDFDDTTELRSGRVPLKIYGASTTDPLLSFRPFSATDSYAILLRVGGRAQNTGDSRTLGYFSETIDNAGALESQAVYGINLYTGDTTASQIGVHGIAQARPGTGKTQGTLVGVQALGMQLDTGTVQNLFGVHGTGQCSAGGTVQNVYGVAGRVTLSSSTAINVAYGVYGRILDSSSTGSVGVVAAGKFDQPASTISGSTTNNYALLLASDIASGTDAKLAFYNTSGIYRTIHHDGTRFVASDGFEAANTFNGTSSATNACFDYYTESKPGSGGSQSGVVAGTRVIAYHNPADNLGTTSNLIGTMSTAYPLTGGTVSNAYGVFGRVELASNSTIGTAYGVVGSIIAGTYSGTLTTAGGGRFQQPSIGTARYAAVLVSDGASNQPILGFAPISGTVVTMRVGSGSPESSITAPIGSIYLRTDGGAATTLYVKESGTGNTGWVGK